ncbi:YybH family protein [Labrys okinawensis]|uniref:YybH family protein n=1 Tax=Labrys okinawensis TaxID=346911 RepID=UPI0039BC7B92
MTFDRDHHAILNLIEAWCAAVRRRDYEGILKHHSPDMLMFDVPGPFQSEGREAYRATWDLFLGWSSGPVKFEFSDIRITAGEDVAFATAHGHCYGPDDDGKPTDLDFRLTMGLRKIAGEWIIEHEHHSVPAP